MTGSGGGYHGLVCRVSSTPETRLQQEAVEEEAAGPLYQDCCGQRWAEAGTGGRVVQFPSQLVQAASWWADPSSSEDTAPPNRVSDLRLLSTNTSTSRHQVGNLDDGF